MDPDGPDPRNLFRAHWYNDFGEAMPVPLPAHVVLPPELTGVPSPIVVLLGDRFPMIHSHKLIAAYGCLAPRIVTGQFDPREPARGVALDGQLLPRWRGRQPHHAEPTAWRCCRRA